MAEIITDVLLYQQVASPDTDSPILFYSAKVQTNRGRVLTNTFDVFELNQILMQIGRGADANRLINPS